MMEFIQLINGGTIFLIAVATYLIIWAVKMSKLSNQFLPVAALIIGAVIGVLVSTVQGDVTWLVGLIDGMVAGAVSVGGNELIKSIFAMVQPKEAAK
ncbi:phage holin family protein [Lactiplantibacillus sp. WILCCON 0030]|uniref:Phage holin family protein n=1 Tax=Lactiplantibacillus brownii TaxID=3069269 RepID=A0ABU1A866_9LACO|nr:phage holin family protein [Lactiplantibacillus brownii]MDQ7937121.1 phage holin family protein [Lactiplantibacillus brownii]